MSAPNETKAPAAAPPPYSYQQPPPGVHAPGPQGYPTAQQPAYGFQPPPQYQQQPQYPQQPAEHYGAATVVNVQPVATEVLILNGCPHCRHGVLEEEYSCLGIFCAIFFFPIGILCCLLTRERRCTNCRASY